MTTTESSAGQPCHVMITGGAGFLGVRLARTLLSCLLYTSDAADE